MLRQEASYAMDELFEAVRGVMAAVEATVTGHSEIGDGH
jgi:hypothetical protein